MDRKKFFTLGAAGTLDASLVDVETSGSTIGANTSIKNVKGKIDVGDHSIVEID